MEKFIREEIENNQGSFFKVLEIGSWLGSSAILWADGIKKYNKGKGLVICVDPWVPFIKPENIGYSKTLLKMEKALKKPFHLGVSMAVGDFFNKRVSSYEGFWIMRKTPEEWQQVEIS